MFHFVAHAVPGSVLFREWEEGVVLYERLVSGVPGVTAACVMPDHVHVLTAVTPDTWTVVLGGYARWRNARRGERGPVFRRSPPPERLVTHDKVRRSERYVHLNPCRARLVDDPLAWSLSTYRDVVGLSVRPAVRADPDPHATHAYTSADPTVHVRGTELPMDHGGVPDVHALVEATCALLRVPPDAIQRRGAARSLFLRAARALTDTPAPELARMCRVHRQAVHKVPRRLDPAVRVVASVSGDRRFASLEPGDLRFHPRWRAYRYRR